MDTRNINVNTLPDNSNEVSEEGPLYDNPPNFVNTYSYGNGEAPIYPPEGAATTVSVEDYLEGHRNEYISYCRSTGILNNKKIALLSIISLIILTVASIVIFFSYVIYSDNAPNSGYGLIGISVGSVILTLTIGLFIGALYNLLHKKKDTKVIKDRSDRTKKAYELRTKIKSDKQQSERARIIDRSSVPVEELLDKHLSKTTLKSKEALESLTEIELESEELRVDGLLCAIEMEISQSVLEIAKENNKTSKPLHSSMCVMEKNRDLLSSKKRIMKNNLASINMIKRSFNRETH